MRASMGVQTTASTIVAVIDRNGPRKVTKLQREIGVSRREIERAVKFLVAEGYARYGGDGEVYLTKLARGVLDSP